MHDDELFKRKALEDGLKGEKQALRDMLIFGLGLLAYDAWCFSHVHMHVEHTTIGVLLDSTGFLISEAAMVIMLVIAVGLLWSCVTGLREIKSSKLALARLEARSSD